MRAEITGGEVSDYKGIDALLDDELPLTKMFIADKGYDSDAIRNSLEANGATPVIPGRANRKQPIQVDAFIYALRNTSSAASTNSNAQDAWQPVTTKPPQAVSASFISWPRGFGSGFCQHDQVFSTKS